MSTGRIVNLPNNMEKFFENKEEPKREGQKDDNKNSFRNLKMATMISLGLLTGGKGEAQEVSKDTLDTNKIETASNTSERVFKNLKTILESVHIGDKFVNYEKEIDTIISQNINFTQEELQEIFTIIPQTFGSLSDQSKNPIKDKDLKETGDRFKLLNQKLFDYVYGKSKSPFAELEGGLSLNFEKELDSSIPDLEGKKLFNLVFNEQFDYDKKEIDFEENDQDKIITTGSCDFYKGERDGDGVVIRLSLEQGLVSMFQVHINKGDKTYLYIYSIYGGGNNGSFNQDKYNETKEAFIDLLANK